MRGADKLAAVRRLFSSSPASVRQPIHRLFPRPAAHLSTPFTQFEYFGFPSRNASFLPRTSGLSTATTRLPHEAPPVKDPRQFSHTIGNDVVLYQYEACPFCNKVRAFLDYHGIPYKIVEVNPISKKEIKWSEYKKVPILTVDGESMGNSSDIIDKLFTTISLNGASHPETHEEEKQWLGWVDKRLVHLLAPNIYRTPSEALESFDYITNHGNFSMMERIIGKYMGAAAMYFVAKKLKKMHKIEDERLALYEAVREWMHAIGTRKYLGGPAPNLADLAVFGVLRPIRNLRSGKEMVEKTDIGGWYSRMQDAVGRSSCVSRA